MDVETQHEERSAGVARLRTGMRWLALGSIVVLGALMSWAILSASNGSPAGMVAANSGSIAVVLAWVSGHVAITKRLQRLAAAGSGDAT
ncbi:hypothetical protein [Microbacterium oleivorans]|uniref:Uncharacterized protein n=1 Tax=Microbacterium oleivorans TaxID=273677 RepID=A0A4R5YKA6_9MICO|nr:hypothetical protein [Microbacterium oleivorans]TDL45864.1 hypothetical protein E2R54_05330 [Microbacterium oleivorans]